LNSAEVRPWETLAGFVLVSAATAAAVTDLLWHRIPNWITYTAACWGIMLSTCFTISESETGHSRVASIGAGSSFGGGVALFLVAWLIFSITRSGAGDVKLAAAIGTLLGPAEGMDALLYTFAIAGFAILGWSILRFGPVVIVATLARSTGNFLIPRLIGPPSERQRTLLAVPVPLAPFFAVGSIWALVDGTIV
jgi:prepilin peptidase CpaA